MVDTDISHPRSSPDIWIVDTHDWCESPILQTHSGLVDGSSNFGVFFYVSVSAYRKSILSTLSMDMWHLQQL